MNSGNLKPQFDQVLNETILPLFKKQGFKRKGLKFIRIIDDITQTANLQKSQWNDYNESIKFTFNIGVYSPKLSNVDKEVDRIVEFPDVTDCFFQGRLGMFSHKKDHWYELNAKTDKDKFTTELIYDLEKFLFGIFNDYNSLEDMNFFANLNREDSGFRFSSYQKIILFMETGRKEKGLQLLKEEYKQSLIPKRTTHTINFPDGSSQITVTEPSVNKHYINSLIKIAKFYGVDL